MRWSKIHRIELNRSLHAPGHTASKTQGLYYNPQRVFLYGFIYRACGPLNVRLWESASDFVIYHKTDRAFFMRHFPVRCRGPPPPLDYQKFRENGGIAMWQKNDGKGADSILQNQFTSYLVTAIRRKKSAFLKGKEQLQHQELAMEQADFDFIFQFDPDFEGGLSLIEQIETPELLQALKVAKERERYIFLNRVLEERSFSQLASELGITYKATTHAYYRFVERLRRQLGGDEK